MKTVTTATTTAWQAADKGGANRAMMRATIQVPFTQRPLPLALAKKK